MPVAGGKKWLFVVVDSATLSIERRFPTSETQAELDQILNGGWTPEREVALNGQASPKTLLVFSAPAVD
jgi:hypothetical protein